MNTKKLWWYVAVTYVDETVDVVRTPDYEKAFSFAEKAWRQEREEFIKTKDQGLLDVEVFDGRGRVLWSATDEPSGLGKASCFDHVHSARSSDFRLLS